MATAGYSGTPLVKKLGIKENARVRLEHAPEGFVVYLGPLPTGAELVEAGAADVILLFVESAQALEARFRQLAADLVPTGRFWVAWPKKASRRPTDLTFDIVQRAGLEAGLVDTKICAVDETWSGLCFMVRLKDRPR
jgi:hypothetical protein